MEGTRAVGGSLEKAEKIDYSELGSPGLTRFGSTVQEEFLTELQGANGRKIYDQMRKNDPVVAAMLRAIGWILQSVKWNVEPDTKEENEPADFIEDCKDNLEHTWSEFLSEAATVLPFGFSLFEQVYIRREDGEIGWKRFGFRAQDTVLEWEFDSSGYPTAAIQVAPPDYKRIVLPFSKCLLLRLTTEKANPEGESILRAAYRPYYYLQNIQEIEGIGLERDLAGMPTVYLGHDCTKTGANSDLALMKDIARNVRRDEQECIVIPKPKMGADGNGILFELLSSGGEREFDTGAIIGRYEQRMAMSVLAQWLMLGMQSVGSYALSSDQSDFFRLGIDGTIRTIGEQFTKQAIMPLLKLNPKFGDAKVNMVGRLPVSPDYSKFAAAVNQLVQAQVLDPSDQRLKSAVADALGLPQPMIEIDTPVEEPEPTTPIVPPGTPPSTPVGPHDQNANTMGAESVTKADSWNSATDAYAKILGKEYTQWSEQLSNELADAEPDDYDDIVAAALLVLATKLKAKGRADLADAFKTGANNSVSPNGWTRFAGLESENEQSIDTSLIPSIASVDWRQVIVGGAAAILAALTSKTGLVERYAGVYWRALHEGAGEQIAELGNPRVRRVLNDDAKHCVTCPDKEGEYESWDDMVAQVGIPGDGSDACLANCRCWAEYWDGKDWVRF
jgi:hypothetical protein